MKTGPGSQGSGFGVQGGTGTEAGPRRPSGSVSGSVSQSNLDAVAARSGVSYQLSEPPAGVATALCRRTHVCFPPSASSTAGRCSHGVIRRAFAALLIILAVPGWAQQPQQKEPHAGYIFPAGGRQGAGFEARLGGQYLDGASALLISGAGVKADVVRHYKILTPQQVNGLRNDRERIAALEEAGKTNATMKAEAETRRKRYENLLREAGLEDADEKALTAYRKMFADPKRQLNPAISEYVVLRITIDPQAAPGDREVRLRTSLGLTNPVRFQVGRLAEATETEPNDRGAELAILPALPVVMNGQIMPGDVDRFRFAARKGQQLVATVAARRLIPYLADAVPGWFQPTLGLYDAAGREVAFDDDRDFDPDPVLACTIPADGEYTLELHDSIYRGREDFVYRLTVGEVPFVSGVFPLGGRAGAATTIQLTGCNLPRTTHTFTPPAAAGGMMQTLDLDLGGDAPLRLPFAVDVWPERTETESNDKARVAERVELPVVLNGRIGRPGDRDFFRFEGRKDQALVAEILARRLGSPLDSVVRLYDAKANLVASSDDVDDKGAGLLAHQADSRLLTKLPADGTYYLEVADTENRGGPGFAYRCRLGAPRSDFELRIAPSSLNLRAGATHVLTVQAVRRDGFEGDIALELEDAPKGFVLGGAWIPAGQDKIRMTLVAPPEPTEAPVPLRLVGQATMGGVDVRRTAVPADDMMQAFFYRHLVPAESLLVSVLGRGNRTLSAVRVVSDAPAKLTPGGKTEVQLRLPWKRAGVDWHVQVMDPPEGLTVERGTSDNPELYVLVLQASEKMRPGLKGNLIIEVIQQREAMPATSTRPAVARSRSSIGLLPAVPFEVVAPKP